MSVKKCLKTKILKDPTVLYYVLSLTSWVGEAGVPANTPRLLVIVIKAWAMKIQNILLED